MPEDKYLDKEGFAHFWENMENILEGKVNVKSINLEGKTTTILAEVKKLGVAGIDYARFMTLTDGGSSGISDKPTGSTNGGFCCVAHCQRRYTSSDYEYQLTCFVHGRANPWVAYVGTGTSSITWFLQPLTTDSALSSTSSNPVQNKVINTALSGKNKTIYTAWNISPDANTPASWKTKLGGEGIYWTWYNTTGKFTNQPSQYGMLRTVIGADDVRQDFYVQTSGVHWYRTGNGTGWYGVSGNAGNFKSLGDAAPGNGTLTIQKNGTTIDTFTANSSTNKTINITVPVTAADVSALPDSTKYGSSFELSVNSSTFVVTASLKDQDGNVLGTTQTIDLPLESVVVSGSFDSTTKKIILTLQNGNTVDIPVGDLVAGLQTEITSSNKLSSDLVDDTNHTNKFVTAAEKTKLSGIAAGAEVNQNAFSNVKVGSTTVAADSKTDTVELTAGNYIDITADATNDKVTISSLSDPPRTVLYLSNDIGYENPFKIYKWSEETGLVEITHSELSQLFRASSGNDVIFHYAGNSDHVYTALEFGNETSEFTVMDSWGNDVKIYSIASSSSSDTDFEIYDEWTIQEKLTQGSQISISNGIISVAPNVITSIDWTSLWQ